MPYMISSNIPASRQNLILTCRRPLIHQQNRVVILCKFPFLDIFVTWAGNYAGTLLAAAVLAATCVLILLAVKKVI